MKKCELCKKTDQDEVQYGEFLTRENVSVHMFCLVSLEAKLFLKFILFICFLSVAVYVLQFESKWR